MGSQKQGFEKTDIVANYLQKHSKQMAKFDFNFVCMLVGKL